jgi:hypothetical protein
MTCGEPQTIGSSRGPARLPQAVALGEYRDEELLDDVLLPDDELGGSALIFL